MTTRVMPWRGLEQESLDNQLIEMHRPIEVGLVETIIGSVIYKSAKAYYIISICLFACALSFPVT